MVGAYYLYQYKFNDPKVIVNKLFETAKESFNKEIENYNEKDKLEINGNLGIEIKLEKDPDPIFDIIKDLKLQFNGQIDYINKLTNIMLKTKYKDDKLVDAKLYSNNDGMYILLDGIYDKYLKLSQEEIEVENPIQNITKDDISTIINSIIDAINIEFNKLEIKQNKTKIKVDDKEIEVINNYIELKDKEIDNFNKGINNTLKNNSKFIEAVKKINKDVEKIFEKEIEETEGVHRINIYTDNSLFNKKLVSIRLAVSEEKLTRNINIDIIDKDEVLITLTTKDNTQKLRIKTNNGALNLILSDETTDGTMTFDFKINYEKIKEVTKEDVSNSKNMNELTEEEINDIMTKIQENEVLQKIVSEINRLTHPEV